MESINIHNLELRYCKGYEIIEWIYDIRGNHAIVIASWDSRGDLIFCEGRPFRKSVNRKDFWFLAKKGQKIVNKINNK